MRVKQFALLLLAALIPLCGCNLRQTAEAAQEEETGLAAGQYEVYGKIRSANGNEIVLVIGTLSGPSTGGRGGPGGDADPAEAELPGFDDEQAASDRGGQNREGRDRGREGGGPPDMDGGFSGSPPDMGGEEERSGGGAGGGSGGSISLDYTGEEVTYLIPVTADITTGQGENARSVRFTQLAEKNIVRLVLDQNDAIVSVQVLA